MQGKKRVKITICSYVSVAGVVYRMMSYDEGLSAKIHNKQFAESKSFKFFCFNDIIGRYRIENKEIVYGGFFEWEIRSANDGIINTLFKYTDNYRTVEINHQKCEILSAEICRKVFLRDKIDIKMNTPVFVYHTDNNRGRVV